MLCYELVELGKSGTKEVPTSFLSKVRFCIPSLDAFGGSEGKLDACYYHNGGDPFRPDTFLSDGVTLTVLGPGYILIIV